MRVGMIVGKFLPLHKGHISMIERAARKVDKLYVLACFTDGETIPIGIREGWLRKWAEEYNGETEIVIGKLVKQLGSSEDGRVSDPVVSKVWAEYLKEEYPDITHFIGSEPYIEMMADSVGMESIIIDLDRELVPISATKIRNNFEENKEFLPEYVQKEYVKKIAVVGIESSGKSTFTDDLAKHLGVNSVEEYGRTYCLINSPLDDSKDYFLTKKDFENIAIGHNRLVLKEYQRTLNQGKNLFIVDTEHIITQAFYKRYLDKKGNKKIQDMINFQEYDLIIWLDPVTFEDDGTRRKVTETERATQIEEVKKEFELNGIKLRKIYSESRELRVKEAVELLKKELIIC